MITLDEFEKIFLWYRHISMELLDQFPQEELTGTLSNCSLPINCQFIDLGTMQLRIVKMITGNEPKLDRPANTCVNKSEITSYLNETHKIAMKEFSQLDPQKSKMDWFGRMQFDFEQSMNFMLAHESMHHGEIISYLYSKNLPTPKIFKETWGLC